MKLTNSEKLTLIMLSEIYEKLGIDGANEINPKFIKQAIYTDNTWALDWEYTGVIFDASEPDPPEVTEVVNYLDMWSFIEEAYERLNVPQKTMLEAEAGHFGKHVEFIGFDGNNESEHISVARFMINQLNRFQRFKDRDLNSHMPTLGRYRRMYYIFEPIRRTLLDGKLKFGDLVLILKSQADGRDNYEA